MNNSNTSAILRSLIVYAVCVPLAIFFGWTLASPTEKSSLDFYGVLAAVLVSPLFLRWHLEMLVFSWSAATSIIVFLLPGQPSFWMVMACVSLTISVLERILSSNMQFIRVPQVTWPLLAFVAVVWFTAEMTGGVGLKTFGSSVYGGRKYMLMFISFASYFALTARPIPPEKASRFITLFFLGNFVGLIGSLYPFTPYFLAPIFLVFPPSLTADDLQLTDLHYPALGSFGLGCYFLLMSKCGVRGIFLGGRPWRVLALLLAVGLVAMGGYRSSLILVLASFTMMFFWEGLHRTPLLLVMILVGLAGATALVPMAHKLPWSVQRGLAFVPWLDLDKDARASADDSTEWRLRLWTSMLPQVPPHLLLGKGLAFTPEEFQEMMTGGNSMTDLAGKMDASQDSLAISSDYHNGMLSLIIPFGVWGVITVVWFLAAGTWVLYRNAKYGRDDLKLANAFLLVLFFFEGASFVSCFAGLQISSQLADFVGYLGLSIALNNGVCQPAPQAAPLHSVLPFRALPRPRPAFQR